MDYELLAAQLRRPEGEMGMEVTSKMNENNVYVNRRSIDILNIEPGEKVLEIGMANGFFCEEIVRTRQALYTGCDFSESMVEAATKLNAKRVDTSQASFHLGDAAHLPFVDNSFDKVFTVNTIYFWHHAVDELGEILRVMKPGAKLVVGIRSKASMQNLPMVQYGFKLYDAYELECALTDAGFCAVKVMKEEEPVITVAGKMIYFESLFGVGKKP
ncbi:class I SAM-dependent methyltransferase [Pseudochryseolinea flava]|uniref:Class I SAM-dependent methyltransferase n=1 Tax=Pseudochryseolinea flava TaxID=2059302 RepID=A0A364Y185_9BACT|nr:class I SAM-dependent methyltransferase [Pseudochryseolinea flava]RAW00601.1 class I SAM-dependent methyltransferase [Pseudochryseolinea flava]